METLYSAETDLLYIRMDEQDQTVINKRLSDDVVLDIGEGESIVGIEILDASKHLNVEQPYACKSEKVAAKCIRTMSSAD